MHFMAIYFIWGGEGEFPSVLPFVQCTVCFYVQYRYGLMCFLFALMYYILQDILCCSYVKRWSGIVVLLRITTIALFSSECSGIAELIVRERACKFTAPHCPGVEVCTLCLKKNSTLATFKIYRFKL